MSLPQDQAWFHLKTYGYGWGLPARWQGWVLLIGYLASLLGGALVLVGQSPLGFVAYSIVLSLVLTDICAWKSEPPRWRWGD